MSGFANFGTTCNERGDLSGIEEFGNPAAKSMDRRCGRRISMFWNSGDSIGAVGASSPDVDENSRTFRSLEAAWAALTLASFHCVHSP